MEASPECVISIKCLCCNTFIGWEKLEEILCHKKVKFGNVRLGYLTPISCATLIRDTEEKKMELFTYQ